MFVIKNIQTGYYFHNKGRIILFENLDDASAFLNHFVQYAIGRRIQETQDPSEIITVHNVMSQTHILEKDFVETPECGVILFREMI